MKIRSMQKLLLVLTCEILCALSSDAEQCGCPQYTVTYECTVEGDGATVWRGDAMNCSGTDDEIVFLHAQLDNDTKTCNAGAIRGQSLSVMDNEYTSQLNVSLTSELIGQKITCIHNYYTSTLREITMATFTVSLPPPRGINSTHVGREAIMFEWEPVGDICSGVYYNVIATNCGNCVPRTNFTNTTCTGAPTDGSQCVFSLETVICGNITGKRSDPVLVKLNDYKIRLSWGGIVGIIIGASAIIITITVLLSLVRFKVLRSRHQSNFSDHLPTDQFNSSKSALQISLPQPQDNHAHYEDISHCIKPDSDLIPATGIYSLCHSDYDEIHVSNNIYCKVDNKQSRTHKSTVMNGNISRHKQSTLKMGSIRSADDALDLESAIASLSGKLNGQWYAFGQAIGVATELLDELIENGNTAEECLSELLNHWMKHHPDQPTWKELADALEEIGDNSLPLCVQGIYTLAMISEDDNPGESNNDIPPPKPPRLRSISLASVDAV